MDKPEPQRAIPFLGVALIAIISGIVYLAATHAAIPSVLEMLAYGCVVGISGVSTPHLPAMGVPAVVVNQPNAQVTTDPAPGDTTTPNQ